MPPEPGESAGGSSPALGRLERVDPRVVWPKEARDFTPWLAQPENLRLLGEAIGLELELVAREHSIGPYWLDILCRDVATGRNVVIENQLERSDHSHMGQLLTYAAALAAAAVIWVAREFVDEHRAVLDWLNEITNEEIAFFGVEIELWRIGASPLAPRFNVVSRPNAWSRGVVVSTTIRPQELSESKQLQLRFWQAFRKYVLEHEHTIRPTKPLPQHWMNISIDKGGFKLAAIASMWDSESRSYDRQELRAELQIYSEDAEAHFEELLAEREAIEADFGVPLIWYAQEGVRTRRIYVRRSANLLNEGEWASYFAWLLEQLERLKAVFTPRLKRL